MGGGGSGIASLPRRAGTRRLLRGKLKLLRVGEEHVGGLEVLALAVVEIKEEIIFEDVVVGGEAEFAGGLINGVAGAFQLDESADGGFIEVNEEVAGPAEAGGQTIGGAVLFVAEPATEAEAFKNPLEGGGVGEDHFDFLANLVAAIEARGGGADGELLGRAFEGEKGAGRGLSGGGLLPCRGRSFGTDAEELAVLGEPAVRGIEDDVVFVDARGGGFGAQFLEKAKKGFGAGDAELDFGFAGHKEIVVEVGRRRYEISRGKGAGVEILRLGERTPGWTNKASATKEDRVRIG